MNILSYSISLGEALRSSPEGKKLYDLYQKVYEKFKGDNEFSLYNQCVEHDAAKYNFFCWDIGYHKLYQVYEHPEDEKTKIFLKAAELVIHNNDIKELCNLAVLFGKSISSIVDLIISSKAIDTVHGITYSNKVKNAAADLKMSVQRSGLFLYIISKLQTKGNVLTQAANLKYEKERREKDYIPYSKESKKFISEYSGIDKDYVECIERIMLLQYITQKGIFEGYWDIVNKVDYEMLLESNFPPKDIIKEVSFTYKNSMEILIQRSSWLYEIKKDKIYYVMAHSKKIDLIPGDKTTVSGQLYPSNDVGFLKNQKISDDF